MWGRSGYSLQVLKAKGGDQGTRAHPAGGLDDDGDGQIHVVCVDKPNRHSSVACKRRVYCIVSQHLHFPAPPPNKLNLVGHTFAARITTNTSVSLSFLLCTIRSMPGRKEMLLKR